MEEYCNCPKHSAETNKMKANSVMNICRVHVAPWRIKREPMNKIEIPVISAMTSQVTKN